MKYLVVLMAILTVFSVISIENVFAEEEISILVENDVRKVYYTGENITSAFSDSTSSSITFETGNNAKLDVKVPQIYKYGGQLFVLRNGEEVLPDIKTDNCFYYVSFETQVPEKIELIFTHWPEATELIDNCETFTILSPLKQFKSGIPLDEIQCREWLEILFKTSDNSPVCVKPETKIKLIERGWDSTALLTLQKTWVEIDPIQCLGNPWEQDWLKSHNDDYSTYPHGGETIKDYYKKYGVIIYDVKSEKTHDFVCEGCNCPIGNTLYFLIPNSAISQMTELGFKVSENQSR